MATTDRAFRALSRNQPDVVAEMLRVLVPGSLPPGATLTIDDMSPTQVDALPQAMDADCMALLGDDAMHHIEFQGYRDTTFSERCVWYHVGAALRFRGKRRVRSFAIWLIPPPNGQSRRTMRCDDISVRVKTIVLPNVPATKLLANPKTVCLAPGANSRKMSDEELCQRTARLLREHNATWPERHVAVVAALAQNRYGAMVTAMEQAQLEPVLIEDLVKYGEDRGFAQGISQGISQGITQGISQGTAQERLRAVGHRLGRTLTPREQERLHARVRAMTSDSFYSFVFQASAEDLETWLRNAEST